MLIPVFLLGSALSPIYQPDLPGGDSQYRPSFGGSGRKGIVEECCFNQCSYRSLKKYCCKS